MNSMYSSEDLERFYFQYQTEALPHGESLQSFCVKNKVPYNLFEKWYKDTRKKVVEVKVWLSLKTWGIALKFLFLHHEHILFPND